ncbi:MAG: helix-turn-helix transcriptional regulator [Firmicutes bacterium]|uniref:Putative transcriptional regulator n=1 Tax=Melghirimyces thermohalophilus TaxID=1236220 RepID=A0A1G6QNZ5_9BACL|nr:helix-turn-helix transcriptional regulator [Melghirimyces thermohalophilus]MDA8354177.1 helix-turn-helix transcriptional regulator [Bacillota bacterium]SDC93367.1 putative transcriptional regulator [Melghirimyces thermohalophilus]
MVKNRIRELRKTRKLTQEQLALDLQVTRQTIIAIEGNRYNPSLELALKIANYFDLPVDQIFTLTKED